MYKEINIESALFPPYPNEQGQILEFRFGKRLCEFVMAALEKENIRIADFYSTDSCYEMRIDHYNVIAYIQIGNIDGENNQFIISIEPKQNLLRKLFKKTTTQETIELIYELILNACQNTPQINIIVD